MFDSNWDLIDGQAAHEIEVLNHTNQVNVIEALFRFVTHHAPPEHPNGCDRWPNVQALKEIHRTGTLFLLDSPGEFRVTEVHVVSDGAVVHDPPSSAEVPELMERFGAEMAQRWAVTDPLEAAAYALWRINWIHPFKNGNGRTARAFAYACLCLKYGFWLPGNVTVIDLIVANKPPFEAALRAADVSYAAGEVDLSDLRAYLEDLLTQQLASI